MTDHASKRYLRKSRRSILADWLREFGRDPDRVVCWSVIAFVAIAVAHGWIR